MAENAVSTRMFCCRFSGFNRVWGRSGIGGWDAGGAGIPTDPTSAETNVPGIYAIGDVSDYPGKLKLILTGFSEAAFAAHHAYKTVFPDKALHFEYSTTKGVPSGN